MQLPFAVSFPFRKMLLVFTVPMMKMSSSDHIWGKPEVCVHIHVNVHVLVPCEKNKFHIPIKVKGST